MSSSLADELIATKSPLSLVESDSTVVRFVNKLSIKGDSIVWGSSFFNQVTISNNFRLKEVLGLVFNNKACVKELNEVINRFDKINLKEIETLFLNISVKYHLSSSVIRSMIKEWHLELPREDVIVHYGTSSGIESAWLLDQAPQRQIIQIDNSDAAVESGQKKLQSISADRETEFISIKRRPWKSDFLNDKDFAMGSLVNRVPPFPLENRKEILQRAFSDLLPGKRFLWSEPNKVLEGNARELENYLYNLIDLDLIKDSGLTEFEIAIFAMIMKNCLIDKKFHMFQDQMEQSFFNIDEAVAFAKEVGFNVICAKDVYLGKGFYLILEKPASSDQLQQQFNEYKSAFVKNKTFTAEVVSKIYEPLHNEQLRDLYKTLFIQEAQTKRYGLENPDLLTENMTDFSSHLVLSVKLNSSERIAGMARYIPFYDISTFSGISKEDRRYWQRKKLLCGSIYYTNEIRNQGPLEYLALKTVIDCAVLYNKKDKFDGIYIEVKPHQEKIYASLGFKRIGDNFTVDGWAGEWAPLVRDLNRS